LLGLLPTVIKTKSRGSISINALSWALDWLRLSITHVIYLQDKFLLILSEHAVKSAWIEREVDAALHLEVKRGQGVLFPIRLDNMVLESNAHWATRLHHRHISDFTGWQNEVIYQEAFATLLRHLKVTEAPTL
jgi:TIR domain